LEHLTSATNTHSNWNCIMWGRLYFWLGFSCWNPAIQSWMSQK